jgi:DNA-binding SARP family transcriptional activator
MPDMQEIVRPTSSSEWLARAEGEITFRILGPLAVHSGGTAVALPGNRQRALLAFLLLHANEGVTNEVLLEAVWGSDAGGSMKRLQVAVMRLRKALEPLGPETLRTVTGGYQLAVGAGELDAEVFVCLVREGSAAFEGGDPELGLRLLRAADGLWRGETLADFAFETFAQDAIRRVDEQRLAAIETRIDCELALDRHAKLIPELEGLVATHPTRDRFAARLMLALYRCGRQVDALEVYRSTRTRLASELGLEPGPELQQLEGRILNHDPLLDPPAALPAELDHARRDALVGRSAEYRWLWERWERARAGAGLVVLLSGPRGMGKTRLVAELGVAAHDEHATVRYVSARQGRNDRLVSAIGSARSA